MLLEPGLQKSPLARKRPPVMADMRAISISSLTSARAKEAGAGEIPRCRRERKHSIAAAPALGKYNVGEENLKPIVTV